MAFVMARISMELKVTDEELKEFIENKDKYEGFMPEHLIKRFVDNGVISADSYIPSEQYDWIDRHKAT